MNITTQNEIKSLRRDLEEIRTANSLQKFQLAELIGVSPQQYSDFLNDKKGISLTVYLKAKQIIERHKHKNMSTSHTTDYELQNAAILEKYSKQHATIRHFQSGLGNTLGYVPGGTDGLPAQDITENLARVQALIASGNLKDAQTLLAQIQNVGVRVTHSTAVKAPVNQTPTTREPLKIKSSGQRATVVGTQSFDSTGNGINFSKKAIELMRADAKRAYQEKIADSHKIKVSRVQLKNPSILNTSNVDQDLVRAHFCDSAEKAAGIDRASVYFAKQLKQKDFHQLFHSDKVHEMSARLAKFQS